MKILSGEEKQWLACAIDSEGTIYKGKKGEIQVIVYNTNYDYAKKASDLMGTKIYPLKYKTKTGTRLIYSVYTNKRILALKILKQIEPYLVIKREKAQEGIKQLLGYFDIKDIQI